MIYVSNPIGNYGETSIERCLPFPSRGDAKHGELNEEDEEDRRLFFCAVGTARGCDEMGSGRAGRSGSAANGPASGKCAKRCAPLPAARGCNIADLRSDPTAADYGDVGLGSFGCDRDG
jgi:hypothetical protein